MGGIDQDAGAQYDEWVLSMESHAAAYDNGQPISSGAGGGVPLAVPVKPTDLAPVKSDVKPDVKPAKKKRRSSRELLHRGPIQIAPL